MITIVEVGIPVYKAKNFLSDALDSLVVQTYKKFFVCLSIDCDGKDYSDIINMYRARGLKIRIINGQTNGGPGIACQRIIDTTQASHLIFLDADDILMPRAVEVLYREARAKNYDILRSSFIREQKIKEDILMSSTDNIITWRHGKIYKVQYLKEKNIRFLPELRTDEDAYFNMVAWNSTKNLGMMGEVTYLWRDNKASLTREKPEKEYFIETHMNYINGQLQALHDLFEKNDSVPSLLITNTLINLYYYYMKGKFYKCDLEEMDKAFNRLRAEEWAQAWMQQGENWIDAIMNLKPGNVYEGKYAIFYEESFLNWITRLIKKEN